MINKAIELGLSGIAITDHECLSGAVKINKIAQELQKLNPEFKVAIGNEIYLTDERKLKQKYYHFILIAKDKIGFKALCELSSTAWFYSYVDRGMERAPTLKTELKKIVDKYKGHLIATSACIGGELSTNALLYYKAKLANISEQKTYKDNIVNFVLFMLDLFGSDFYIECAPSTRKEQIIVNQQLRNIAKTFNIKMVPATDTHYLTIKERPVHKAYLNSKDGEREIDEFYEFTYLMDNDEIRKILLKSFEPEFIEEILENTLEVQDKIENYSLFHKQEIPSIEVKDYPKGSWWGINNDYAEEMKQFPNLKRLFNSDDIQERYWINQCWDALKEKFNATDIELIDNHIEYLKELEEEARVKSIVGEKLETNMFRYPNTLQHYIDLIWNCGSIVGAGRGSSCAALNHYLLGITQLDPIQWNFPFFRYLNEERVELGDIDIDICPSKRPLILQKIKEEREHMFFPGIFDWAKNNLGCTLIATFGTEGTKSAILSACRGYRSKDYPDGIDVDEAQFMTSLIPQER